MHYVTIITLRRKLYWMTHNELEFSESVNLEQRSIMALLQLWS